jgi:hypothetical protein
MAVTTSTNVTSTILAKVIDPLIIAYQYDDTTAVPFFRYKDMSGQPSAVASFPRKNKDAYSSVATETTSLTPTTWSYTAVDVTVARYGIAREVSETAIEDSIVGQALYVSEWVKDAAILFGEQLDTDATALFGSVTASKGTTNVALTIAVLVDAMASQRANKARGPQVIHLHDLQLKDLQAAQAAATTTPWATFYQPNADSSQFGGYFMGAPVWASSKNPTANASVDRVGCVFSQGQSAPEYCAFALAAKRMPTSKTQSDILQDGHIWASFARYGVGMVANSFATKIISKNA